VFSLRLGSAACFDCRVSELTAPELVLNYFRWRQEDAARNALNAHCYWLLRKEGQSAGQATGQLEHMSVAGKNELLFRRGVNFNDIPQWQKRGVGLYWERFEKEGFNPDTGENTTAIRRRLKTDLELPMKEAYDDFLAERLREAGAETEVRIKT
jgi:tRNA(His) 5'-end guanylyltransferase